MAILFYLAGLVSGFVLAAVLLSPSLRRFLFRALLATLEDSGSIPVVPRPLHLPEPLAGASAPPARNRLALYSVPRRRVPSE